MPGEPMKKIVQSILATRTGSGIGVFFIFAPSQILAKKETSAGRQTHRGGRK
jgi:hypothetical protein